MPIKLAITGRPAIEIDVENITIGSDRSCTVAFDDSTVMPKHAVIRKIAGRWLIEVRDAASIFVGGPFGHTKPKRLHWLVPGDQIRLTENGPASQSPAQITKTKPQTEKTEPETEPLLTTKTRSANVEPKSGPINSVNSDKRTIRNGVGNSSKATDSTAERSSSEINVKPQSPLPKAN